MVNDMKTTSILGSTGSIGKSSLDVIANGLPASPGAVSGKVVFTLYKKSVFFAIDGFLRRSALYVNFCRNILVKSAKNKIAFLQRKECSNQKVEKNKSRLEFNFL